MFFDAMFSKYYSDAAREICHTPSANVGDF